MWPGHYRRGAHPSGGGWPGGDPQGPQNQNSPQNPCWENGRVWTPFLLTSQGYEGLGKSGAGHSRAAQARGQPPGWESISLGTPE